MSASYYFNLMKGFADAMVTFGSPLPNDELIDYILAGLGKEFSALSKSSSSPPVINSLMFSPSLFLYRFLLIFVPILTLYMTV
jgi:hypothetical protein